MATTTFNGAVSQWWDVAGNWDPSLPVGGDTVILAAAPSYRTNMSGAPNRLAKLTLNAGIFLTADGPAAVAAETTAQIETAAIEFLSSGGVNLICAPNTANSAVIIVGTWSVITGAPVIKTTTPGQGKLVTDTDILLTSAVVMDLRGTAAGAFVIDLMGDGVNKRSIIALRDGKIHRNLVFDFCTIQNGGEYAIEATEPQVQITNCTFVDCVANLWLSAMHPRLTAVRNNQFGTVTGSNVWVQNSIGIGFENNYIGGGTYGLYLSAASLVMRNGAIGRYANGDLAQPTRAVRAINGSNLTCINVEEQSVSHLQVETGSSVNFFGICTYADGRVTDRDDFECFVEEETAYLQLKWLYRNGVAGQARLDMDDDIYSRPTLLTPLVASFLVPMVVGTETVVSILGQLYKGGVAAGMDDAVQLVVDPGSAYGTSVTSAQTLVDYPAWAVLTAAYTPTIGTNGDKVLVPVVVRAVDNVNGAYVDLTQFSVDGVDTNCMLRGPDTDAPVGWFAQAVGAGGAGGGSIFGSGVIE